jgi:uncharacterized Zn-binding protein involved in type VI secretion
VHGCPACPHPGIGPAISGSFHVFVNKRPALRVDDVGIHTACCSANTWQAKTGSETVFIDGRAAHRQGDRTKHCGGDGQLIEGSPNVIVGDTTTPPAGSPSMAPASGGTTSNGGSNSAAAQSSGPPPAHDPADAVEPGVDSDPATLHAQVQADVLRTAAEAHVAFCEECERLNNERLP